MALYLLVAIQIMLFSRGLELQLMVELSQGLAEIVKATRGGILQVQVLKKVKRIE